MLKTKGSKFLITLVLTLVVLVFFSFHVNADGLSWSEEYLGPKPEFSELEGEEVEINVWKFSTPQVEAMTHAAETFDEMYPEIDMDINIVHLPYGELYDSLATTLIAGEGAPEAVAVEMDHTATFYSPPYEEQFREIELTEAMEEDLMKQEHYKDSQERLLGIEYSTPGVFSLYYRKDRFEEAGIDMPIKTYEDFIEAGEKMKEELDIHITVYESVDATSGFWHKNALAIQNENPIYDVEGNFVLNDENTAEAYQLLLDMVLEYEIAVDADPMEPLTKDRLIGDHADPIASIMAPDWYFAGHIEPEAEGPNWRIAPLPQIGDSPNRVSGWGGTAMSVLEAQNDYPELTETFLKYTLTEEHQLYQFDNFGYFPTRQSILESNKIVEHKNDEVFGDQPIGEFYSEYIPQMPEFRKGPGWSLTEPEMINRSGELVELGVNDWLDMIEEFQREAADEL